MVTGPMGTADATEGDFRETAYEAAARFVGAAPVRLRRFSMGVTHYVYEAGFTGHPPLVVRVTRPRDRALCRDAATLNRRLRPLGVPLPELLEDKSEAEVPYLVLERLDGVDLGAAAPALRGPQLSAIARRIAAAQAVVAGLPTAGRYGYAATAEAAPLRAWSDVLRRSLARSRSRIGSAGLFDDAPAARLAAEVERLQGKLDALPPTAFMHDTTTRNVIVAADGALSGVVDVDDLCFGDPRYVLALTQASLMALGGPLGYVRAWAEAAGHALDELFRLYVALFLVDFMGEHGQLLNGNMPRSSETARARLTGLFERWVSVAR